MKAHEGPGSPDRHMDAQASLAIHLADFVNAQGQDLVISAPQSKRQDEVITDRALPSNPEADSNDYQTMHLEAESNHYQILPFVHSTTINKLQNTSCSRLKRLAAKGTPRKRGPRRLQEAQGGPAKPKEIQEVQERS